MAGRMGTDHRAWRPRATATAAPQRAGPPASNVPKRTTCSGAGRMGEEQGHGIGVEGLPVEPGGRPSLVEGGSRAWVEGVRRVVVIAAEAPGRTGSVGNVFRRSA